jgi:hypothetical protein
MMKSKVLLPLIISEIKSGLSPSQICKKHNIKKQNLNYYLRKLKKNGTIEKVHYGIWRVKKEVKISSKASPSLSHQIRGHAFNWRVKFLRKYDWIKLLKRNNIKYQLIGVAKSTPRIMLNGKKVWLTQTGLVIYEPESFFAKSSKQSYGRAVHELQNTINMLERVLKTRLGEWQFTVSREHYGMIKNELARQYNKKGEKLYIRDDNGIWLWIDDSYSLEELETNEKEVSHNVQTWYNDHKKHNFEVNSSWILNAFNKNNQMMNGIQQNQVLFSENFVSHVEVIRELGASVRKLTETVERLENAKR